MAASAAEAVRAYFYKGVLRIALTHCQNAELAKGLPSLPYTRIHPSSDLQFATSYVVASTRVRGEHDCAYLQIDDDGVGQ